MTFDGQIHAGYSWYESIILSSEKRMAELAIKVIEIRLSKIEERDARWKRLQNDIHDIRIEGHRYIYIQN